MYSNYLNSDFNVPPGHEVEIIRSSGKAYGGDKYSKKWTDKDREGAKEELARLDKQFEAEPMAVSDYQLRVTNLLNIINS
jgi:hypothetical protein